MESPSIIFYCGFVQKKQCRPVNENPGDLEPSSHPPGIRRDKVVRPLRKPHHLEKMANPLFPFPSADAVESAIEIHILVARKIQVACHRLGDYPDALPHLGGFFRDIPAGNERLAARWTEKSGEHPDEGRLPCPVGTEETEEFALFHLEAHVVDSGDGTENLRYV
jgi:hypothetical protein